MPFLSPGELPDPEIKPKSLVSPAMAGGCLTTSDTWEASNYSIDQIFIISFKEMATHSSTLAWKISWTEEPDRL